MGEMRDKVEGNLKEAGGKLTGDESTEMKGKAQKAKGKVEEAGNDLLHGDPTSTEPSERDPNL